MKKTFEMSVPAIMFLSEDVRDFNAETAALETQEKRQGQEELVRETFGLILNESLDTPVTLKLNLEDFLWQLFTNVTAPSSPLKLAAHKRHLDLIASELNSTLGKDEIPRLSMESLDLIKSFVDDEEKFKAVTVPYEIIPINGTEVKAVPLPAINVLRDLDFVGTLDHLFNGI